MADTYVSEADLNQQDFKKYHSICAARTREDGVVIIVFTWPRMSSVGKQDMPTNTDRLIVLVTDPHDLDIHKRIKAIMIPRR